MCEQNDKSADQRRAFAARFSSVESEWLVLTANNCRGASLQRGEVLWTGQCRFLAAEDEAGRPLGPGRLLWLQADGRLAAAPPLADLCGYRLRLRPGREDSHCGWLQAVIGPVALTPALAAVLATYQNSVNWHDGAGNNFQLDRDYGCFSGKVNGGGQRLTVSIAAVGEEPDPVAVAQWQAMRADCGTGFAALAARVAPELLATAGPEGQLGTAAELAARLRPLSLECLGAEGFSLIFQAAGCFGDHVVLVNGDEDGLDVSLAG